MLVTTWAWRVMCAPDIFTWNLCFLCINTFQLIYIIYQMRPINFDHELEETYHTLFRPFKVNDCVTNRPVFSMNSITSW